MLYLLRKYLGEYVEGLSVEALRISVWKGIFLSYNNNALFLLLNHHLFAIWFRLFHVVISAFCSAVVWSSTFYPYSKQKDQISALLYCLFDTKLKLDEVEQVKLDLCCMKWDRCYKAWRFRVYTGTILGCVWLSCGCGKKLLWAVSCGKAAVGCEL